ncbi:MAG: hypothetical protein E6K11_06660 [Methanobacteriota archaeon]|nr:MAG: hypothetical protein E6K11_06660 [Euryarchaeota archaeon]
MANRKTALGTSWIPACSSSTWLRRESPKDEPSLGGLCGIRQRVDEAGLTRAPAEAVQVPRIGESPVNFECRLIRAIRVADNIVFFGRVVRLHVRDDVLTEGLVDVREVHAIGRLGGRRYCHAQDVFEVMRPRVTGPRSARPTDAR